MIDRYGERIELDDTAARAQAITDCRLCDDDGYRGSTVCDHTDHTAAAARGMDRIRETMGWKP